MKNKSENIRTSYSLKKNSIERSTVNRIYEKYFHRKSHKCTVLYRCYIRRLRLQLKAFVRVLSNTLIKILYVVISITYY